MRRFLALLSTCLLVACGSKSTEPTQSTPNTDTGTPPEDGAVVDAPVPPSPSLSDETKKVLDDYLDAEHAAHAYPAMALGIVFDDTLVWKRGEGTKNNKPTGAPVDENTIFRIGSITKVLTGAAILKLRDAGKLDLDDPVDKWIPEVASTVSPAGKPKVTIRHLVTHTSGIPRNGDGKAEFWRTDRDLTEAELLASVKASTLVFTPGTRFEYSNFAVALAGLIVGRASGKPYRDYMNESFFTPLSMSSSVWDKGTTPADRFALGNWLDRHGYVGAGTPWKLGASEGMGGLYSTVVDLGRFVAFEGRALTALSDFDAVLSRATLKESQEVQPITTTLSAKVGVNWFVTSSPAHGYSVWHNGSTLDFSAFALLARDKRIAVVGLLAVGDSSGLECVALEVLAAATEKRTPKSCLPYAYKGNAVAIDRVRALIAKPDDAGIDAAFTPEFLTSIPRADLIEFFDGVRSDLGACSGSKLLASSDMGTSRFVLTCDKAQGAVLLRASDAAPHRIDTLYIEKAK